MAGHNFPDVTIHGQQGPVNVHLGDKFVTNNGNIVQLGDAGVDVKQLLDELQNTTKLCADLRDTLLKRPEPVASAQNLADDVEELETLVDTLRFHLEEHSLDNVQGWHRPLAELDEMTRAYQKILHQTQFIIGDTQESKEQDVVHAMAMRADIRRLRLKLNIAIGVVTHCIAQKYAPDSHQDEVRVLHDRLRDLLEHIENEKALNFGRPQKPTPARLAQVDGDGSLVMRRFVADSLDDDQNTLREASMRVSTLLTSTHRASILPQPESDQDTILGDDKTITPKPQIQHTLVKNQSKSRSRLRELRQFYRTRLTFRRTTGSDPTPALLNQPLPPPKLTPAEAYEVLPGGRVFRAPLRADQRLPLSSLARLSLIEEINNAMTPETKDPIKTPSLLNNNKTDTTDEPYTPPSGQSEQLPSFKDYYSTNDIHPGDTVSVLWAYQPRAGDEFELERGDMLKIIGIWDDGWATGVRISSRAEDWKDPTDQNNVDTPPSVSSEIKALPLVCVCVPGVWRRTVEGDASQETKGTK